MKSFNSQIPLMRVLYVFLLFMLFTAHNTTWAGTNFSASPTIGSPATGNTIWLKANSIDSVGKVNFTLGKISGNFISNGNYKVFVNGAEKLTGSYSLGASTAQFTLNLGTSSATYSIRVQRYDTKTNSLDPNVNSGFVTITASNPLPRVNSVDPLSGLAGNTARVVVNGSDFPPTLIINIEGQSRGCTPQSVSSTQGIFNCPLNLVGNQSLAVKTDIQNNGGVAFWNGRFLVNDPNRPPTINNINAQMQTDGSLKISYTAFDADNDAMGVDFYLSNANNTKNFSNRENTYRNKNNVSNGAGSFTYNAAEVKNFLSSGNTYAVKVEAFDAKHHKGNDAQRWFSNDFSYVVTPPNSAPVIRDIKTQLQTDGSLIVSYTAQDAENDAMGVDIYLSNANKTRDFTNRADTRKNNPRVFNGAGSFTYSAADVKNFLGSGGTYAVKVEAFDAKNQKGNDAQRWFSNDFSYVVTPPNSAPVIRDIKTQLQTDGSLIVSYTAQDADNDVMGVDIYLSNANKTRDFTNRVDTLKNNSRMLNGAGTFTYSAADVKKFLSSGSTYAVRVQAFDAKHAEGKDAQTWFSSDFSYVIPPPNSAPVIRDIKTQLQTDGSLLVSYTAQDADNDVMGVDIYLSNANKTRDFTNRADTRKNNSRVLNGAASFLYSAADVKKFLSIGSTYAVRVQAFDAKHAEGKDAQTWFSNDFTYSVSPTGPIVSGFTPNSGLIGSTATIMVNGARLPSSTIVTIDGQSANCVQKNITPTQGTFSCPLDVAGARVFKVLTNSLAKGGTVIHTDTFTVSGNATTVNNVTPKSARLDIAQTFTISGTGLTNGMGFTIEDCEPENGPGPILEHGVGTSTQRAFRCIPRLPGTKRLTFKNAPGGRELLTAEIGVDRPARLGNPFKRGMPAVQGVSLWNGNVQLENVDLSVPGKGLSFTLMRSYNSYSSPYEADRGSVSDAAPWRFNWDVKLGYVAKTDNKQLWVQREDGSGEIFFKEGTTWYPMDQGSFNTIKGDTPVKGQTTFLVKNGLKYIFQNPDLGGLLIAIQDHDGNSLRVNRDGNQRVSTVQDASNRTYTFAYDGNGRLSRVSDFTGRYVEYSWEASLSPASVRLKTVRDVRGYLTTYHYSLQNPISVTNNPAPKQILLTSISDARNNVFRSFSYTDLVYGNWGASSVTDGERNTWNFKYCARQLNGSCTNDPISAIGFETETRLPLGGAKTLTSFNTGGRMIKHVDSNNRSAAVEYLPLSSLNSKNYSRAGLTDKRQSGRGLDAGYGVKFSYTPENNLDTRTDEEGIPTKFDWHGANTLVDKNLHRLKTFTNAEKGVHRFEYTESGNVQSYTAPDLPAITIQRDARGQITAIKDGRNHTTLRDYDANGNVILETDADLRRVRYDYDNLGRVIGITDKRNNSSINTWDAAGNLLSTTDALKGKVSFDYDANNNRIKMTDARKNVTEYSYDGNNRLKSVTQIVGTQRLTTSYQYDALGRISSTTNANNHAETSVFDAENNLKSRANALSFTTQYEYDEDNRVKRIIDPENRITDKTYDKVGRVLSVKTAAGTSSYTYDGDGRMKTSTDPRLHTTQYEYDAAGRLKKVTDTNGKTTTASYDANGNLLSVSDPNNQTTSYTYDKLNRQLTQRDANGQQWSKNYDENGNLTSSTVPGNKTTRYTYDALNRLERINYPDGSSVAYSYDPNGNRETMTDSTGTTRYAYDALNRMSSKLDPLGKTVSYSYDGVGNVLTLGYPNGQAVRYSYDAGERLTSLTDWLGRTSTYTLNRAGQVTVAALGNGSRTEMAYDDAGRLNKLLNKKPDGSIISNHVMTLDGNGNITNAQTQLPLEPSIGNFERNFTYDAANRLTSYNGGVVSHDAAGRIIELAGARYTYNERDQITAIAGNQSASHAYNGDGHRVMRTINGQTSRFVIDANRRLPEVLAEVDANGNVQRNYVYGYGLVAQIGNASVAHFYHFDPTGSTLALTNNAGAVTDSYAYTPYGETTVNGNTVNPFRYVGKLGVMDDGNGMQFMRARYYRPDVARFMSLDALLGDVKDSQTLNRYAYVKGNPIMNVDPSGFYCEVGTTCYNLANWYVESTRPFFENPIVETLITEDARACVNDGSISGCALLALNVVPIGKVTKVGKIANISDELIDAEKIIDSTDAVVATASVIAKSEKIAAPIAKSVLSTKGVVFDINKGISGTYSFIDNTGKAYFGKSVDILTRMKQHYRKGKLPAAEIGNINIVDLGKLPKRALEYSETIRMATEEALIYKTPEMRKLGEAISNKFHSFKLPWD